MKILIADDDLVLRTLLGNSLRQWGHEVVEASDGLEALTHIKENPDFRLAILDWMMPGRDGIEVCGEIRQMPGLVYRFLILLTSRDGPEDLIKGLDAGADDYLMKPVHLPELAARLRVAQRILAWQDELLEARNRLQEEATHDALTGLWNRPAILEHLQREMAACQRLEKPLGVMIVDLDHFKRINDLFGHLGGDVVLREIVKRLQDGLRPYDSFGRLGGEEFLIVAPNCDEAQVLAMAERLRHLVREKPINVSGQEVTVTTSLGVTVLPPATAGAVPVLLRTADAALYQAKSLGRNRVAWQALPG